MNCLRKTRFPGNYFLVFSIFVAGLFVFPAEAQQQGHQANYNRCLHGYYGCDLSELTSDEKMQVREAAHQRNYNNCLHGYYGCDLSKLAESEKLPIQEAAHQRNYNNCLHGYYGCDLSKLTESEKLPVQEAAHQRNYNKCLHGYYGCDASGLTDAEKSTMSSGRINNPTAAPPQLPPNTSQNTPPHYYTNRDGQRVQSPTQSKTLPAAATAQCRDGSYSFSQHHQGTCSHHGGVAKWLDQ
jgi:hypothetical protein